MRMLKENFETALSLAIEIKAEYGDTNSTFVKGLEDVLEASLAGGTITIEEK